MGDVLEKSLRDLTDTMEEIVRELSAARRERDALRKLLDDSCDLFVFADSELSAIAHGRPPSDSRELIAAADRFRKLYEPKRCPCGQPLTHDDGPSRCRFCNQCVPNSAVDSQVARQ